MRGANFLKHLYGLFICICVTCLFPVFPLTAEGASLADLSGNWHYTSFVTGSSAPWWERGTAKVSENGTFTRLGTDIQGNPYNSTGAFSFSSNGIVMTVKDDYNCDTALCQIDSGNTVIVCTQTWSSIDNSSNLQIFTKQANSYSVQPGNWEGNSLDAGPTSL